MLKNSGTFPEFEIFPCLFYLKLQTILVALYLAYLLRAYLYIHGRYADIVHYTSILGLLNKNLRDAH